MVNFLLHVESNKAISIIEKKIILMPFVLLIFLDIDYKKNKCYERILSKITFE